MSGTRYAIVTKFQHKTVMGDCVKRLREIKNKHQSEGVCHGMSKGHA